MPIVEIDPTVCAVTCEVCEQELYRTDGRRLLAYDDGRMNRRPVEVMVAQKHRHLFCSSECATRWFGRQSTKDLLGGYPLW